MAEITETTTEVAAPPVIIPDFFDETKWKDTPTIHTPTAIATDPVIEEKDKQIEEIKPTSDKPNEPEKIPTATHEPIQDRPENTDPATKKDEPLKFANEESEKLYNAILAGKKDEVYDILNEQKKLSSVDKLPPADIIKLNLQYQNKDFNEQEIKDLFDETYNLPEKPIQELSEDDDEFKARTQKYEAQVERIEKRIARDAKPATTELLKLSKEIVLPDIQKPVSVNKEPTQEELAAQKEQEQRFLKSVDDGLNSLEGFKVTYKDEEVTIPVAYKLSKEEKAAMQPIIALSHSNAGEFLAKIGWIDADGNINAAKLAQDLPFILNKETVLQKMITETGNQRYAEAKRTIKNIDYSGGKQAGADMGKTPEQAQKEFATTFFV